MTCGPCASSPPTPTGTRHRPPAPPRLSWQPSPDRHAQAQSQERVLRVVPHSNLAVLDPIWTTAYISRNPGYMIYDTLFRTDEKGQITPPMVEEWSVSPDKRLWTFKLPRAP